MLGTVLNVPEKTDNDIAVDSVLCPHCLSEALRSRMDNPYTIHGKIYVCGNSHSEIIVSPALEEELV